LILYLDTSALVKAYVEEACSQLVLRSMRSATTSASHQIAYVEAHAAFARLHREQVLNESEWETLKHEFMTDWEDYLQIGTTQSLLVRASVLAAGFALRAYDNVHLAAAQMLRESSEQTVLFACFDRKLTRAAGVLGLNLLKQ